MKASSPTRGSSRTWRSALCGDGVNVFAAGSGRLILRVLTPKTAVKCCFGGPGGRELLITANDCVWLIPTRVRGALAAGSQAKL